MPAGMKDASEDNRQQSNHTTAKKRFDCLAGGSATEIYSNFQFISGDVKNFKYMSIDIPTDTVYNFYLVDIDGLVVYSKTGISDVAKVFETLTNNNKLRLCGLYRAHWTWTTARVILAMDMQALAIFI